VCFLEIAAKRKRKMEFPASSCPVANIIQKKSHFYSAIFTFINRVYYKLLLMNNKRIVIQTLSHSFHSMVVIRGFDFTSKNDHGWESFFFFLAPWDQTPFSQTSTTPKKILTAWFQLHATTFRAHNESLYL